MKKHYVLLNIGEIVKDGDEEYSPDPTDIGDPDVEEDMEAPDYEWRRVAVEFIGEAVQETDFPVRRLGKGK